MFTQIDYRRCLLAVLFFIALLWGGYTISLQAQASSGAPPATGAKAHPVYDTVSIKPSSPDDRDYGWNELPNGLDFKNGTLSWLIYSAYGITLDSQISGLPEWTKTDHYSVSARVDEDTAAAWKNLSSKELAKQRQLMLQAMFADRCQLKMRSEVKELPVYDLVIAKGGIKMKEAAPDEKESSLWKTRSWWSAAGPGDAQTITNTTQAGTAQELAESLARPAGRLVVDKTGLGDKKFDFELKWSSGDVPDSDAADAGPSLFKALEEQLGLQLVPAREPVETFVVEHIEKPSPN
jgi:uncharacterized protein (TIGR03435 family)